MDVINVKRVLMQEIQKLQLMTMHILYNKKGYVKLSSKDIPNCGRNDLVKDTAQSMDIKTADRIINGYYNCESICQWILQQ